MGPAPTRSCRAPRARFATAWTSSRKEAGRGRGSRSSATPSQRWPRPMRDFAEVFDEIPGVACHLRRRTATKDCRAPETFWFDPDSPTPFFPAEPVAQIYAEGVLETLDLSLKGKAARSDQLMVGARLDRAQDAELGRCQRRRDGRRQRHPAHHDVAAEGAGGLPLPILGDVAEAYVTEQQGRLVTTRRVRDMA